MQDVVEMYVDNLKIFTLVRTRLHGLSFLLPFLVTILVHKYCFHAILCGKHYQKSLKKIAVIAKPINIDTSLENKTAMANLFFQNEEIFI